MITILLPLPEVIHGCNHEDLLVHFSRTTRSLLKLLEGSRWTLVPAINLGRGLHEIDALSTATAQAEKTLFGFAKYICRAEDAAMDHGTV